MNDNRGFTLIEILVAIIVSLILVLAIGMAIESALKSSGGIERKVTTQQDVRGALELMAMEIRMASYNPTLADNHSIWIKSDCSGPSDNPSWKGIQAATANSITVEMDISDGTVGGDGQGALTESNEIISYNYVSVDPERYITRATGSANNCGGAQPFLGDSMASKNPLTTRVINADLIPPIPIFRYFDGQGVELLSPAGPVTDPLNQRVCMPGCIPDIRMIEITLAVETEQKNPDTKQPRRMIYSTRETLRNH